MADDHLNLKVASDGTIYCAAKTGYNRTNFSKVILLVRRPTGIWDNVYTVTTNPEGTQPIALLNEAKGKIKVVYASAENGGDILYKESSTGNISFSTAKLLIGGDGKLYDYATSTHETYDPEVVILASNLSSTPNQAVGVIASDEPVGGSGLMSVQQRIEESPRIESTTVFDVYPNPSSGTATVRFKNATAGTFEIALFDGTGVKVRVLKQGWLGAGMNHVSQLDARGLANGLYFIRLQTSSGWQTRKLLLKR
jgi:hypothetical protein